MYCAYTARFAGGGSPSQESGVFAWEGIGAVPWVVIHKPSGDHRPQPFAHVTLVETGARRDRFRTRGRHVCHRIEKPHSVPHRSHEAKCPGVQDADKAFLESRGPRVIEGS